MYTTLVRSLRAVGLLSVSRKLQRSIVTFTSPKTWSLAHARRQQLLQFRQQYAPTLRQDLGRVPDRRKKALVPSNPCPNLETELCLLKTLEFAGFTPVVLIEHGRRHFLPYYRLAGVKEIYFWTDFCDDLDFSADAEQTVYQCRSIADLLDFEYAGIRVGRFAVSSALRRLRLGSLTLDSDGERRLLVKYLAAAMTSAAAGHRLLDAVLPDLALFADAEYTPKAEIFDNCLARSIDVVSYDCAQTSSAMIFKRYTLQNRNENRSSLSPESWRFMRDLKWSPAHRDRLYQELYDAYANGDWYSAVGTQFNKRFVDRSEIREQFALDPAKKTAFIFSHILWDAPLMWGRNLFDNYEEWLMETVRAACRNDTLNWVIKVHPANIGKAAKEEFEDEPAEMLALRKQIRELPPHVHLMPAACDISTYSLFDLMDYCLTVRGTVGIEAAIRGIPVLTGGTGRYDHKGFTVDPESRDEYLKEIAHLQEISPLSSAQRELAERYAYGLFVLRPLRLNTVTFTFNEAYRHSGELEIRIDSRINAKTKEDWSTAEDLTLLARWLGRSTQSDFLLLP